ncbi:porin family protein, partial [Methylobacterium sp. E-046]|nr:porin family protein [Methylobacterium sp. E-046]
FAYGGVNNQIVFYGPNTSTPFFVGRQNNIEIGYAYGGGIEYAAPTASFVRRLNLFNSSPVTVKVEYLHFELGHRTIQNPGVNGHS